jgi:hypothetical protein
MELNKCVLWFDGDDCDYHNVCLTDDQIKLVNWLEDKGVNVSIISNYNDESEWVEIK